MNGMICQGREAGLLQAQAWIDSMKLGEVAKAKWFVQKIPLNKVYNMDNVYLFYPPDAPTTEALRQEAAELNARKLTKIMALEDQIKELRSNLPDME
ncbi:MAG: hypothetical protein ACTSPB_24075 [Candidatus Thorarchaeota archaeon]